MEQYQHIQCHQYLATKKWYVGKGGSKDLLEKAGMTEEAKLLKFTSSDGYTVNLTVRELLRTSGSRVSRAKISMTTGISRLFRRCGRGGNPRLVSVEGSDNPEYMNELTLLLMLGQRAVRNRKAIWKQVCQ